VIGGRGASITAGAGAVALLLIGGAVSWWMQARPGPLTLGDEREGPPPAELAPCQDQELIDQRRQALAEFGMPAQRPKPGPVTELGRFELQGIAGRWLSMRHPVFDEPMYLIELLAPGDDGPRRLRVAEQLSIGWTEAAAGALAVVVLDRSQTDDAQWTQFPMPSDSLGDPWRHLEHAELRRRGSSSEAWWAVAKGAALDAARLGRLGAAVDPDDVAQVVAWTHGAAWLAALADPGRSVVEYLATPTEYRHQLHCGDQPGCWSPSRASKLLRCGDPARQRGWGSPTEATKPGWAGPAWPMEAPAEIGPRPPLGPREPWRLPLLPSAGQIRQTLGQRLVGEAPPATVASGPAWLRLVDDRWGAVGDLAGGTGVRPAAWAPAVDVVRPGRKPQPRSGPPRLWGTGDGPSRLGQEVAWIEAQVASARRQGQGPWGVVASGPAGVVALHAALAGVIEGPVVLVGAPVTLVWPADADAVGADEFSGVGDGLDRAWLQETNALRVTRARGAAADPWVVAQRLGERVIWVDPLQADRRPWTKAVPGRRAGDLAEAEALAAERWAAVEAAAP